MIGRDLREHGVVADARELKRDVADREKRQTEQQVLFAGGDEHKQCCCTDHDARVDAEPGLSAAGGVGDLADDGRKHRDDDAGNEEGCAELRRNFSFSTKRCAGDVHGENERGDDRIERRGSPIP